MANILDRKRDFGEVIGDASGARYFQDGVYFDAHGKEIVTAETKPAARKKAEAAETKPAAPAGDSQIDPTSQLDTQLSDSQGE